MELVLRDSRSTLALEPPRITRRGSVLCVGNSLDDVNGADGMRGIHLDAYRVVTVVTGLNRAHHRVRDVAVPHVAMAGDLLRIAGSNG